MWSTIRDQVELPRDQIEAFDPQLLKDDVLRESVTGEVISKVVTRFLIERNLNLKSNGRSDYPDLCLFSADYSGLGLFKRKPDKGEIDFGAALKGTEKRPVRVPDGLEIKTCKNRIRVDCHHPHVGLHFVLVFKETARFFAVTDLAVAFLRPDDYHEAGRNTTATTVKYSFNGDSVCELVRLILANGQGRGEPSWKRQTMETDVHSVSLGVAGRVGEVYDERFGFDSDRRAWLLVD